MAELPPTRPLQSEPGLEPRESLLPVLSSLDTFPSTIEAELSDIEHEIAVAFRHYDSVPSAPTAARKPKKAGRTPCSYTSLLQQFIPASKMKKDNLRTRLLRAYKRCLRDIRKFYRKSRGVSSEELSKCWPACFRKKTQDLRPNDLSDSKTQVDWRCLIDLYLKSPTTFDCRSRSGPRNDGAHKKCRQSSYNNDYCRSLFSSDLVWQGFAAYVELVFGHKTSTELCERFAVKCCVEPRHSERCDDLWSQLEVLVKSDEFLL